MLFLCHLVFLARRSSMAGTGEQNVLLRRRQITPQNSTNTGAELLLKAKQFVQHGRAPRRPSRVLADPTRTHRTNLWTRDILVAVRFSVRGVCLAIRRALMQIQGDLIFLPEDFPVSRGPPGDSGNHSECSNSFSVQTRRCHWA